MNYGNISCNKSIVLPMQPMRQDLEREYFEQNRRKKLHLSNVRRAQKKRAKFIAKVQNAFKIGGLYVGLYYTPIAITYAKQWRGYDAIGGELLVLPLCVAAGFFVASLVPGAFKILGGVYGRYRKTRKRRYR